MNILEQKSDYSINNHSSAVTFKMATKVPTAAPVITSSSSATPSPSVQSHTSNVAAASSALNNNNSISSGAAATSIITAPLMSQPKSPNNNTTPVSNVSTTVTPGKSTVSSVAPTGSSSATATSSPPVTTSVSSSTPARSSDIKTTTGSATVPTVTTSSASSLPSNTKPAPAPIPSPTKPTDLKTTNMNGGSTAVMKQPPPPVTILPPTPAATPPSMHRQPPSLPQQSVQSGNTPTNQKPQTSNPPPSSSTNNTPVKQSSVTQGVQEKIENQVKPTQPLPLQHQGSGATVQTQNQKAGIEKKDQASTHSGNQDQQKVISNVTSSVTNPASSVTTAGASNTNTSNNISTTTPATKTTVGGAGINDSVNKKADSSVSQVSSSVINNSAVTTSGNSSAPASTNSGKKMENEGPAENLKSLSMEGNKKMEGGGGDAQILQSGNSPNLKSDVENNKTNETVAKANNANLNGSNKPGGPSAEKASNKADLILSKENPSDMNRSMYIPTSNEPAVLGKEERFMNGGKKQEEIGDDVRRIMEAIENAGLCGPKISDESFDSGPESHTPAANKASKIARSTAGNVPRPSTATTPGSKPRSRPGTAAASPQTKISPTKPRPATASTAAKNDHENESPNTGAVKNAKGKAAPASGLSNGSPGATLPPKSAASGPRTSTSRVASAKGNTAPTNTISTKTPNQNKNSNTKVNGVDSSSASLPVETETGTGSATGSRSTSRLRPSSSLYRPTASSALKGVSSPASQNSPSNHNLQSSPSTPRTSRSSAGARQSRSSTTMGDSAGGSGEGKPATLRDQFTAFARFGNKEEDGKHITLSNCDKWMKQAKVIDGKKITTTDTSICFKKLFKTAKKITFEDFKKYVEELAKSKKIEPAELLEKLANCGPPGLSSATKAAHSNVVDRLTDTSKYTGSHKERFDSTGKGRGIEGRKDVPDGSGYVAAFKEKLDIKDGGEVKKEEPASASPTPAK